MSVIIQSGYSPTPELTHARIGYESIAYGKTPTASSAASGYPAIAATYPTTYEYWQPNTVPATWAIDNAVPVACDFVGLVGDFNGGTVDVQYSDDGSSWTTQVSGQITGRVTMFLFESVTARYWRIQVTNQIPSVSVVYIGKALAMQRRIYQGHSPLTLSRNTELTNNISEGGQYLGRSIVRQGVATDAAWSHLKADWYRSNFDPFVQSARTLPFFFAWRPSQFPQELGFVWTDGDVQPTNSGPKDYMSVSLNMRGIYNTSRLLLPGSYDFRPSQVLTASRATTATYIDDDGILRTAAINEPRWQDGQLLVEGAATNLCLQSQALNLSPWAGSVSASLAAETYLEGPPFWVLSKTLALTNEGRTNTVVSVGAGVKVVWTFALLSGSVSVASFGLYDQLNLDWGSSLDAAAFIDDGPGTLFGQFGGRFDVSGLSSTVPTFIRVERTYAVAAVARIIIYPGRVVSTTVGDSVKATRSQVCIGDTGGSYILTTTAAATRAADIITVAA